MAALGIQGNGESGSAITEEAIDKTLKSLENNLQRVGFSSLFNLFWETKKELIFGQAMVEYLFGQQPL